MSAVQSGLGIQQHAIDRRFRFVAAQFRQQRGQQLIRFGIAIRALQEIGFAHQRIEPLRRQPQPGLQSRGLIEQWLGLLVLTERCADRTQRLQQIGAQISAHVRIVLLALDRLTNQGFRRGSLVARQIGFRRIKQFDHEVAHGVRAHGFAPCHFGLPQRQAERREHADGNRAVIATPLR